VRGRRGILQNIGILTLGQALGQLLSVVALVFLADHLGAHWFGVVQIGVTFMAYALIVGEWGMMSVGIREVARLDDLDAVRTYVREHVGLMATQAALLVALGLLVLPRLPFYREDPVVFVLYLLSVVPQVFLLHWVAVGLEHMTWVGAAKTSRPLIYAVLVLTLLIPMERWTGIAPQRLAPAFYLVALCGAGLVIAFPLVRWFGRYPLPKWPPVAEARRRWGEATPIAASIIVLRVLMSVDILVLGLLATPETVGNYAAAARVIALLMVAIEVLWSALLPRFSRLAKFDRPGFERALNLYFGCILAGLIPVAVGGALVAPDLMQLLYGEQFPEAGAVFRVLAISTALLAAGTFLGNTLISEDRQKAYVPAVVTGAVVAITATSLLVPRLGGIGASYGMAVSQTLLFVWMLILSARRLRRSFVEAVVSFAFGAIVLAGVVVAFPELHVLIRIAVAAIVYVSVIVWPVKRLVRSKA